MKYKTKYPAHVLSTGKKNVQVPDPEPSYASAGKEVPGLRTQAQERGADPECLP